VWENNPPLGPFHGHPTLAVGLSHFWKLDEASGTRADLIGGITLADGNTVGSAAKGVGAPIGLPDTVAHFVAANNENLSHADFLGPDATFSAAVWVKPVAAVLYTFIDSGGDGDLIFRGVTGVGGTLISYCRGFLGGPALVTGILDPITAGAWNLVGVYHNAVADLLGVSVNGAPWTTAATGGANGTFANFLLGMRSGNINPFDGDMSLAAMWSKILTNDEINDYHNNGNALHY